MPRNSRPAVKSVIDRFAPANESIVCPLHGSNSSHSTFASHVNSNTSSNSNPSTNLSQAQINFNNSPRNISRQTSSSTTHQNGNASRKSSQTSISNLSSIKSPTLSHETNDLAHSASSSSNSSSTLTLKSNNLAQPEEDDLNEQELNEPATTRAECTRFTRQALYTYRAKNHLIDYKYSAYGGTCHDLPK